LRKHFQHLSAPSSKEDSEKKNGLLFASQFQAEYTPKVIVRRNIFADALLRVDIRAHSMFWCGGGFLGACATWRERYPLPRIHRNSVHVNQPVKMRATGPSSCADVADYIAFIHMRAGLHRDF
jgi:hypothetical protein